jgi:hypothetical protein
VIALSNRNSSPRLHLFAATPYGAWGMLRVFMDSKNSLLALLIAMMWCLFKKWKLWRSADISFASYIGSWTYQLTLYNHPKTHLVIQQSSRAT